VNPQRVADAQAQLGERGLIAARNGGFALTEEGTILLGRLVELRRERLGTLLSDWSPQQHAELAGVLRRLARDLCDERPPEPAQRVPL
jgi:Mn-dependent DtxR family transcriptional regulator